MSVLLRVESFTRGNKNKRKGMVMGNCIEEISPTPVKCDHVIGVIHYEGDRDISRVRIYESEKNPCLKFTLDMKFDFCPECGEKL